MLGWLKRNISEIADDRTLRYLGSFLCLIHVATYIRLNHNVILDLNTASASRNCWPYLPHCEALRFTSSESLHIAFLIYLVAAIFGAVMFLRRGSSAIAYVILAILTFSKWLLIISEFRNMGNYHYMGLVGTMVYLFLPAKKKIYPLTVVSFYLAAGILKLHPEWLSGQALASGLPFGPPWFLDLGCAFVVILELVLIFGLLSRNRRFALGVFGLLTIFHAVSYYWVGYFYPTVMSCLLAFFPLHWYLDQDIGAAGEAFRSGRLPKVCYVFLALFAAAQIYPWLLRGDPALEGDGRGVALNMFDAKSQCHTVILARFNSMTMDLAPNFYDAHLRVRCDPVVFWNIVGNICRANKKDPEFQDVDIFLNSRRTTDTKYTPIIAIHDACENFQYKPFFANNWLQLAH